MMTDTKDNIYRGTYGDFLAHMNRLGSPFKDELVETLKNHNRAMDLKELIMTLNAPVSDIMDMIELLKNDDVVRVSRQNSRETVILR